MDEQIGCGGRSGTGWVEVADIENGPSGELSLVSCEGCNPEGQRSVELENWVWDEVAVELEWMGDEAVALASRIYDAMDDDGATTMTIEGLTAEEVALLASVQDAIRHARTGDVEGRAEYEAATTSARAAVAAAKGASANTCDAPTRSRIQDVAGLWTAADEGWRKAEAAGLRLGRA